MIKLQIKLSKQKQMYKEVKLKMIRDQNGSQNTLLRMKMSDHAKNQVFISKQQRFPQIKSNKNEKPGPGAYNDPLAMSRSIQNLQHNPKRSRSNHLDGFIQKQHQWIFGSNRLNFSQNDSGLGPGAYDVIQKSLDKSTNSWSKSDRFAGNLWNQNNSENAIGPGSYDLSNSITTRERKKQMSIFKSKSPKTFLEKIYKDTKRQLNSKGSSNGFQLFANEAMTQDSDGVNIKSKESKKQKFDPSFLSKSKRYQLINPQNGTAGPGSYEIDGIVKSTTKKLKSVSTFIHHQPKKPEIKSKKIFKQPGPATYNIDKYNFQKEIRNKISSLKGNMPLDIRFKEDPKTKSITLPGPGHYNRQRYMMINEKDYEHKPLVNHHEKIEIPFLSSSSRINEKDSSIPFGNYNLNLFDMSEKAKKKKDHLEKLRSMDISIPGFQSSERRTTFNLGKLVKERLQKLKGSANDLKGSRSDKQ